MKIVASLSAVMAFTVLYARAETNSVDIKEYIPIDNKVCGQGLSKKQIAQLHQWGLKPGASVDRVETLNFETGAVCRFKIGRHAVVALKNRTGEAFDELYNAPVSPDLECGVTSPVVDIHKMNFVPQGASKPKAYLVVEAGTLTLGCCGAADKAHTEVTIYDLASGLTPVYKMKLSDSCEADKECGGKCLKTDKKGTNHGTSVKINWDWCEDTCDSEELRYQDYDHKKKYSEFLFVNTAGKFALKKD